MATTTWLSCIGYIIMSTLSYHVCKGFIDENAPLSALSSGLITSTALLMAIIFSQVSHGSPKTNFTTGLKDRLLKNQNRPLRELMSNCTSDYL